MAAVSRGRANSLIAIDDPSRVSSDARLHARLHAIDHPSRRRHARHCHIRSRSDDWTPHARRHARRPARWQARKGAVPGAVIEVKGLRFGVEARRFGCARRGWRRRGRDQMHTKHACRAKHRGRWCSRRRSRPGVCAAGDAVEVECSLECSSLLGSSPRRAVASVGSSPRRAVASVAVAAAAAA